MPPKKAAKKSKDDVEAERRRQEEEERLARELEEKRQEEERLRKEAEARKLKEQQHADRIAEIERLKAEVEDHAPATAKKRVTLEAEQQREAKEVAWSRYVTCDSKPDATSFCDLNTYVSLSKEEKVGELSDAIRSVASSDNIARSLQDVLAAAHADGKGPLVAQYEALLGRLWESSLEKLDRVTAHLLQFSDELEEGKNGEVIVAKREERIRYGLWVNNRELKGKKKLLDFGEAGMSVDVPKQVAQTSLSVRNVYLPFDRSVSRDEASPSHQGRELVLGGVYVLDVLAVPPPPKKVKGWVLRPETSLATDVQRLIYPLGATESASLAALAAAPSIRCTCEIPSGVIIPPEPRVSWWDPFKRAWSDEFISDVDVLPEKRVMRFQTLKAGVFALTQPLWQDLPYKSWSVEPVYVPSAQGPNAKRCPEAVFSIVTPRFTVEVLVSGHRCRLQKPDLPELSELMNRDWAAGELLHHLSRAGIHLMPSSALHKMDTGRPLALKAAEIEQHFPDEVASVAASFDVRSSTLNQQLSSSRSTFYIRESSAFTGKNQECLAYVPILLEMDECSESARNAPTAGSLGPPGIKFSVVEAEGSSEEEASPELRGAGGHETHVFLSELVRRGGNSSLASEEAIERVEAASVRFQNTIKQLLEMTRVIAFC